MSIGPLRHDAGFAAELVLVKPGLDVRGDRLAFAGTGAIFDDGAELPGNPLPEQVIVRPLSPEAAAL
ncbi:hypothetical protein AYO44_15750 [Planctomycetaceae bacterium SCGC AG-212-F19]|nr:hypothetical protein AYO44_15750 [Planctomycetaceae bacterium SCGC AG-212-F19]